MMENHDKPIMVSVWCRTYNHVNYIKDALDGLVSQQTDFIYKVIVFDLRMVHRILFGLMRKNIRKSFMQLLQKKIFTIIQTPRKL